MSNEINIPKKRGRKPKNHNEESTKININQEINETNNEVNNEVNNEKINKNNDFNNEEINETNNETNNEINNEEKSDKDENIPKKRGRKPKNKVNEEEIEKIPKKRGRKPKEKVYSIKELPKTFYEENKNEMLILHLPINLEEKDKEPVPLENETNYNIHNEMNNEMNNSINNSINNVINNDDNLPTQMNLLEVNEHFNNYNEDEITNKQNISTNIEKNKAWEIDQKNCNKVIKKNLRNILYEFINCNNEKKWPEKTNISCWWCCHCFDNTPCSLPYKYKKEKFHVKGIFCSFNCTASYNFSLNDENVYERYSLLNLMYKKLYYRKFIKINLAPPRESLKMFGGYLSIEEFRENCLNNDKIFSLIDPPLISIIPKIEESMNHNKDFEGGLKFNVNENILQKTHDSLKLKRKKPINNPNNSLQTFMDLKIV